MATLFNGNCLDVMRSIPDNSIDLILCDLPYGTTACPWDSVIPIEPLWQHYKRLITPIGAIVLTASQPFTSVMVMSNIEMFKYTLVWEKSRATGHVNSKNKPMKKHEDILIFSPGTTNHQHLSATRMTYNPLGLQKLCQPKIRKKGGESLAVMGARPSNRDTLQEFTNYPSSIIFHPSEVNTIHPTQKPVSLMKYLIETYSNTNNTVLDNCMGSGTTGVACKLTNRNFIGIENDQTYFQLAKERIETCMALNNLFTY
jgi:site-specific DNA-methyltransferase (adenine-specific)